MSHETMPPEIVGVVLAGGRSSRMGREKAFLRVGDETLFERQFRVLREVGVVEIALSIRRELLHRLSHSSSQLLPSAPALLLDEEEGLGPLAGIVAAMAWNPDQPLMVMAVDMPEVPSSLLSRLLSSARGGGGAAPVVEGRWEPLCAIYPPGEHDTARALLTSANPSPAALLDALAARGKVTSLPISIEEATSLRSWNAPADLPEAIALA